jgi:mono/diheme cytochrome c family protein
VVSDSLPDIPPAREPPAKDLTGQARNVDQAGLLLLILLAGAGAVVGTFLIILPSWRPTADMDRQPYHKPYTPSLVFNDGMSERPLVSGVVPRPAGESPGVPYVAVRTPGPANYPVIALSSDIPLPITRQLLERGQEQYNIYCSVCHGTTGEGNGMIPQRGFYAPPSYYDPRLIHETDAHFYNVITNGYATMFSYSDRVVPDDRWAIVAYIRALQMAVEQSPQLSREMQKPKGAQR